MNTDEKRTGKPVLWALFGLDLVVAGWKGYGIYREAEEVGDGFAELAFHCSPQTS